VRFEFFHRLTNLALGGTHGDSPHVSALEFDRQARVLKDEYLPLVNVRGLPCWPAEPDFAQLVDGARLQAEHWDFECHWDRRRAEQVRLEVQRDFDFVVLGVGMGVIPEVCRELVAHDARWRNMVERVTTVQTQAFQLWMNTSMEQLGWARGAANVTGFVEPFDTWADMSHLIRVESHADDVRAIAYFCSVLPDRIPNADPDAADYPARLAQEVRANAIHFMNRDLGQLWPRAAQDGSFRWEALSGGPTGAIGEARFESQFWRANVNPSDRYTLSLPGSLQHRISPLDATFDNLTIAGDWTDCGFNQGCVEAAVMSGRLAAHAISQSPPLSEIVGYDHP
jgi:uncharacterized protein with NAD-binding domain and iron-sulfur cluster